jgi:asparagine synthase (glutamine-hydrolysing)
MSGIGGIINFRRTRVDREKSKQVADAVKQKGPDGIKTWERGSVFLAHGHFWTTPEEVGEEQPIVRGDLTLTADARIDNREELLPHLKEYLQRDVPSDAEVILAAYQKWGDVCPRYLIGDFAFALWDDEAEKLFCARDPVGVRLFNYTTTGNEFIFGSSLRAVLAALDDVPEINFPFIADLLAGRWDRWVHETGYQEVFRLPPAYCLTVASEGIGMKRYWTFGKDRRYHFESDEAYIACFREILTEAVRARMRSVGPVALTVSGGLDSSSIACIVNNLIETGKIQNDARIYSNSYMHTPYADEKEFLDAIISCCPHLPLTRNPSDGLWALQEFGDDNNYPLEDPEYGNLRAHDLNLFRLIKNDGYRVGISGHGGDNVLNIDAYLFSYFLKDLDLKNLFSELPYFAPFQKPHRILLPPERILTYADISPPLLRRILISLKKRSMRKYLSDFLIPDKFENDSPFDFLPPPQLKSRSALWIYDTITGGFNSALHGVFDTYNTYIGFEWRHPFFDRRVIDFMLALPPSLCFKKGYSRYILRQSMVGLLPDKVRLRKSKTTIQYLLERGLREKEKARAQFLIRDSRLVQLGFVNPERLSNAWELFWEGKENRIRPLSLYLCGEAWLRHQEKIRRKKS